LKQSRKPDRRYRGQKKEKKLKGRLYKEGKSQRGEKKSVVGKGETNI
jgi:hypothetical protein